jgi:hypothetical protein
MGQVKRDIVVALFDRDRGGAQLTLPTPSLPKPPQPFSTSKEACHQSSRGWDMPEPARLVGHGRAVAMLRWMAQAPGDGLSD